MWVAWVRLRLTRQVSLLFHWPSAWFSPHRFLKHPTEAYSSTRLSKKNLTLLFQNARRLLAVHTVVLGHPRMRALSTVHLFLRLHNSNTCVTEILRTPPSWNLNLGGPEGHRRLTVTHVTNQTAAASSPVTD